MTSTTASFGSRLKCKFPVFVMAAFVAITSAAILPQSTFAQNSAAPTAADDLQSARALSRAFQRVAKQAEPAVVHITAMRRVPVMQNDGFFSRPTGQTVNQPVGFGSGVIVDSSGVILTNNHVVEVGESHRAKLTDGREFDAVVVGRDPLTDLAVVRIKDAPPNEVFPTAAMGDSDSVEVGDWVIAIGSPFGFANTVTTGIVSAKSRSGVALPGASRDMYQDFIQTDAAINPGNSGGPLLDLEGRVVGINSAIATRAGGSEGIGFAIPMQIAKAVMDSILKSGRVVRGWVGLEFEELTSARLKQLGVTSEGGVLVSRVVDDGPASAAGFQPGDIITRYNARPMTRFSTLRAAIAVTAPGTKSTFDILREGKSKKISVQIADWSSNEAQSMGGQYSDRFGGIVRTIDPEVRRLLGRGFGGIRGVIVQKLDLAGPGAGSGFEEGDIIVAIDESPTRTAEEFAAILDKADMKQGVKMSVIRNRIRGSIDLRTE
ncbi:MAG: trypsin-like peptidase domain-containing protein [Phycisphaeraceae bacterium]|nr:trypsin-like peptidase domain-containing protein [Phycisphaeraceae bacterium]